MLFLEESQPGRKLYTVKTIAYAPDNQCLAAAAIYQDESTSVWQGEIVLWNIITGEKEHTLLFCMPGMEAAVASDPLGRHFVGGLSDNRLRLWNVSSLDHSKVLQRRARSGIQAIAFSPDGRWLACLHLRNEASIWDMTTCKLLTRIENQKSQCLAFTPDSRRLVLGGGCLLHLGPSEFSQATLPGIRQEVRSLAISADGQLLAAANAQAIQLHEFPSMKKVLSLGGMYRTLAFSPNSRKLLAAGFRGISLWEVGTGRELTVPDFGMGIYLSVAFSPDGMTAAAGGFGNPSLAVWDVF